MEGGGDKTPGLTLSTCPVLKKGASNITNLKTYSDIFRHIQKGKMEMISGRRCHSTFPKRGHGLVAMCYLSLSCLFFN